MKYWINTISRDHVMRGIAGGFTQANHGKPHTLRRMQNGDRIVFYSSKVTYEGSEPLQKFTALGTIADDEVYQAHVTPEFEPWRRNVTFLPCTETPIRPLIDTLSFIVDKTHWGYKFRFGLFEIPEADFELIERAMTVQK